MWKLQKESSKNSKRFQEQEQEQEQTIGKGQMHNKSDAASKRRGVGSEGRVEKKIRWHVEKKLDGMWRRDGVEKEGV